MEAPAASGERWKDCENQVEPPPYRLRFACVHLRDGNDETVGAQDRMRTFTRQVCSVVTLVRKEPR